MSFICTAIIPLLIVIIFFAKFLQRRILARRTILNCGLPVIPSRNLLTGCLSVTKDANTPWKLGQLTRVYGKTYALMQGIHPTVVTSDPDIIKQICFKQFNRFHSRIVDPTSSNPDTSEETHQFAARGRRWKRIRSLTSRAFSTQNIRNLFPVISDSIERFILDLSEELNESEPLELHRHFQRLTFDVISRCCLGESESCQHNQQNLSFLLQKFTPRMSFHLEYFFTWCIPELKWLLTAYQTVLGSLKVFLRLKIDPMKLLNNNLQLFIDAKLQETQEQSDFLYHLSKIEDSEWNEWKDDGNISNDVNNIRIVKKLTRSEIVAQCRFLSTAGFDTTANTLTYVVYLLAQHPDEQQKLQEEIMSLDEFNFDNIQSLKILDCTIMETLRLYPHASLLQSRVCTEDCQIGGYKFRKGVNVIFDTWSLHRETSIWGDDALEFKPFRFCAKESIIQAASFMPFGAGPRQCIGMRFALLEVKTCLCHLLRHYHIHKANISEKYGLRMSLREMGTVWPDCAQVILKKRSLKDGQEESNTTEVLEQLGTTVPLYKTAYIDQYDEIPYVNMAVCRTRCDIIHAGTNRATTVIT